MVPRPREDEDHHGRQPDHLDHHRLQSENPIAGSLIGPTNMTILINNASIILIFIVLTIINVFIVGIHPRYVGMKGKLNVLNVPA